MATQGKTNVHTMFSAQAITTAAGPTSSTEVFKLNTYEPKGFFSVIANMTSAGAATMKIEYSISHDGTNFYIPEDETGTVVTEIVTAQAKTVTKAYAVTPVAAPYYKLVVTISVANATAVTITMACA